MSPVPVCCALIEQDGKVLIAQRPHDKHLGGYWEFPGGKIETGESAVDALHREIQEELGCQLTVTATLPTTTHTYPGSTIELHPFVARLTPESPLPQAYEHVALRWLTPAELAEATLAPADLPVLADYFSNSR